MFSVSICVVLYNSEKCYSKCCYVCALQISPQGTNLFSSELFPNVPLPHPTAPPRAKVGDWLLCGCSLHLAWAPGCHPRTMEKPFSPLSDSIFNIGIFCSHNFLIGRLFSDSLAAFRIKLLRRCLILLLLFLLLLFLFIILCGFHIMPVAEL